MKLQKVPVLAIALLLGLTSAPQAWAGRGGGHGGGGFHGGGFHGGGFRGGGGFHGGAGFHHGFRGGPGFHHGGRFRPGFAAPAFFAGGAGYPYYYASAPFAYPPSPYDPWFNYQMGYTPYPPNYRTNYWASATLAPTYPQPQPVAESATAACPGLVAGDVVGNVQRVLRYRGFYRGPIDGLSSPATRAAIQLYDRSVGLPPTGAIDARLLTSMGLM